MNTFDIQAIQDIETPFYYYNLQVLHKTLYQVKKEADKHKFNIHYAIKANHNSKILSIIQEYGLGVDCVSGLEIERAIENKFTPDKILFAGVGKTDQEIQLALEKNILCFNVESIEELSVIGMWAKKMNRTARIALRINPNIKANTHPNIITGVEGNKFGIYANDIPKALKLIEGDKHLILNGIHFHIGSQIIDLEVYKELCLSINKWNKWFLDKGYTLPILNVGGGLGINYKEPDKETIPDFKSFFDIFAQYLFVADHQKVHFELGRSLVGNCGSLIARVLYIKEGKSKKFAILDAGMTELLRPALYQAFHKIEKVTEPYLPVEPYDIVGPICESSDYFGKSVNLPQLKRGDLIAIRSTGAYGEVMSSRYNLRKEFGYYYKK